MTCPYLEYRDASNGDAFDTARAYCTAVDEFVQPMRADICNDRYALEHARDCEIYRAREDGDVHERDGDDESMPRDGEGGA